MADNRRILLKRWENTNLFANFGTIVKSITINGFRGLSNLSIDFEYPITAISGTNGSGKSTIGQLAACACNKDRKYSYKRHFASYFFPANPLDPSPFTNDANVRYHYVLEKREQDLTVSRSKKSSWDGYQRQPYKNVFYVGFALFIPKVERRDLSIYAADVFTIEGKRSISENVRKYVSNILNNKYDEMSFQEISHDGHSMELGLVQRQGYSYSENNMGFGEARLIYMVDMLENRPEKSLFIFEEPEISLHEDAQYKFIKYLMDVCIRKGHQIILSTHSSIILDALPAEGRKFLIRNSTGVKILDRVSANRAKSILADGQTQALTICVEDTFAALKLREAIRKLKPEILPNIKLSPLGDTKAVATAVDLLRSQGINVIGVRDADKGENKTRKLFKLPGTLPPEKEVYEKSQVQSAINSQYGIDVAMIFAAQQDIDHHNYGKILSEKAYCSEDVMNRDAIYAYFDTVGINTFDSLIQTIETEM